MRQTFLLFIVCATIIAQAKFHSMMPDPILTPGATDPRVTQATLNKTVCAPHKVGQPSWVHNARAVSEATKKQVMKEYGIDPKTSSQFEIDHFESLEVGGSNSILNLWPQYYDPAPGQTGYLGARVKDQVEDEEARELCAGTITLKQAQDNLRNWTKTYQTLHPK